MLVRFISWKLGHFFLSPSLEIASLWWKSKEIVFTGVGRCSILQSVTSSFVFLCFGWLNDWGQPDASWSPSWARIWISFFFLHQITCKARWAELCCIWAMSTVKHCDGWWYHCCCFFFATVIFPLSLTHWSHQPRQLSPITSVVSRTLPYLASVWHTSPCWVYQCLCLLVTCV